jgi:peptide/nickel transport system substrate-binding protein
MATKPALCGREGLTVTKSKRIASGVVSAVLAASLAACSGGGANGDGGGAAGGGAPLTVAAYSQPTLQPNFNPFSPNALRGTMGLIYEQLYDFNTAGKFEFMPSLATEIAWADAGKTLDVTLDARAKWSDGSPLTSDDVVFTFEYMKEHELLALPLTKASKTDKGVRLEFSEPAYAIVQDIGRTAIVPAKLWQGKNPDTELNTVPVGSGPYKLGRVTGQQAGFEARDDYWKQKVPVGQINYITTSSTSLLAQQLVRHEVDLAYAGIPDMQQFVAKDPANNHLWPVHASMKPLLLNLKRKPFQDLHVRKGFALALNREQIANAYNPGVYAPVSATGLYQEDWTDWIPEADRAPLAQNQQEALAEFAKAGYHKNGDQLVGPDGKQLTMGVLTVSTFADGMAYTQELVSQLTQIGVKATVEGVPPTAYTTREGKGDFDAIYGDAFTYGANPYNFYSSMLAPDSKHNFVGWDDPATNRALAALAKASPEQQKEATLPLEKIMVEQVPVVPLLVKGTPYMYSTMNWTGWPSERNPYTTPDPGAISGVYAAKLVLSLKPAL